MNVRNWSLQLDFGSEGPLELLTDFTTEDDAELAYRAVREFLEMLEESDEEKSGTG